MAYRISWCGPGTGLGRKRLIDGADGQTRWHGAGIWSGQARGMIGVRRRAATTELMKIQGTEVVLGEAGRICRPFSQGPECKSGVARRRGPAGDICGPRPSSRGGDLYSGLTTGIPKHAPRAYCSRDSPHFLRDACGRHHRPAHLDAPGGAGRPRRGRSDVSTASTCTFMFGSPSATDRGDRRASPECPRLLVGGRRADRPWDGRTSSPWASGGTLAGGGARKPAGRRWPNAAVIHEGFGRKTLAEGAPRAWA